jgi:NAD(P)-dependent dehydrogenase (short-subunit alcohol dehydrogenase family)
MAVWPSRFASAADRTALITGGTGGIGFYVAKLLCRVGLTVVIPARPGIEHEAASAAAAIVASVPGAAVVVPDVAMNLGSFASVRAFGAHLRGSTSIRRIDVLVLNAGRGGAAAGVLEASIDGREAIMHVNVLGHALLVAELLPLLRRAAYVRIAVQSSGARFNAVPTDLTRDLGTSPAAVAVYDPWRQ